MPDLVDEYVGLEWLAGRAPVPQVRAFLRLDEGAWLLTTAVSGRTAEQLFDEQPRDGRSLTRVLAEFMRRMHAIPTVDCPFDAGLEMRMAAARRNVAAGLVDEDDFDPEREGWTAGQVLEALKAELPLPLERLVTHGDFSLGNLLIENGEVSGCIDVGRVGVADPYQDLAILWNCLRDYGDEVADELWPSYGLDKPDERRLRTHLLLDELF